MRSSFAKVVFLVAPSILALICARVFAKQTFDFKADARILDLMTKNVYSAKEVSLREVLSNACDALSKLDYLSLTNVFILKDNPKFEIKIIGDEENNTITIVDTGIGMTKDELIKNLGTVAQSGTAEFDQNTNGTNKNMIGQFGVGFYSTLLVSDKVTVISKAYNEDKQYVWETSNNGSFSVDEDTTGEDIGRGTKVIFQLKPEFSYLAKEKKLRELADTYSKFFVYPVYFLASSTVKEEVPLTEEELKELEEQKKKDQEEAEAKLAEKERKKQEKAEKKSNEEGGEDNKEEEPAEEEEEEDIKPREYKTTKIIEKPVKEFIQTNTEKVIWSQNPKDVTEKQYEEFYELFTGLKEKPLTYTHFKAESDYLYSSILYVPERFQYNPLDPKDLKKKNKISLYARKMFISDSVDDFLPDYLGFVTGVIEFDDIPLNISREVIQDRKNIARTLKKQLTNKILSLLKSLADDHPEKYEKFYKQYATSIRLGVKDDDKNRLKLANLIRFQTSFSTKPQEEKSSKTSLSSYVSRAKDKQTSIFYICGPSIDEMLKSPFAEAALRRGYEILLFDDPYDQFVAKTISEFEKMKFQDIGEQDFSFGDETEEDKKSIEQFTTEYKPLVDWWLNILKDDVDAVIISKKLTDSPCAVSSKNFGMSGYMLKVMNSQAGGKENPFLSYMNMMKKTIEINPRHPTIQALNNLVKENEDTTKIDESLVSMVKLMYDTALISSGFDSKDPTGMGKTLDKIIRRTLNIDVDAKPTVEVKPASPKTSDQSSIPTEPSNETNSPNDQDQEQPKEDPEDQEKQDL